MKRINVAATHGGRRQTRPANRAQKPHNDWYRITAQSDTATIAIYDEVGYWGTTAASFCDELRTLDVAQIDLRLNSPGGDVYEGVAIYNALIDHPADVTVTVDGMAASIASVILQAGNIRIMNRASEAMIHLPHAMAIGNADDMTAAAAMLARIGDDLAEVYADRAGGTPEMWLAAMRNETWYSAQEAVRAGLADSVMGKADTAATAEFDRSVFRFPGRDAAPTPANLSNYDPVALRRAIREAATA